MTAMVSAWRELEAKSRLTTERRSVLGASTAMTSQPQGHSTSADETRSETATLMGVVLGLASVRWKQLHNDLAAMRGTRRLHRDNDLAAASVALHQVPNGLRHLAQRKGPVDHRGELAGLDELPQDLEVLLPRL
jgi:hypothetical protein